MNNDRRKAIGKIVDQLSELEGRIADLMSEIEDLHSEEQDAYENMPDNIKDGERGQASEAAADALQSAISELENVTSSIGEAVDYLNTASE